MVVVRPAQEYWMIADLRSKSNSDALLFAIKSLLIDSKKKTNFGLIPRAAAERMPVKTKQPVEVFFQIKRITL